VGDVTRKKEKKVVLSKQAKRKMAERTSECSFQLNPENSGYLFLFLVQTRRVSFPAAGTG